MKYVFTSVITKEDKGYSVLCPELGVTSQGENVEDAKANIREAVALYIEDMTEDQLSTYVQRTPDTIIGMFEVEHA